MTWHHEDTRLSRHPAQDTHDGAHFSCHPPHPTPSQVTTWLLGAKPAPAPYTPVLKSLNLSEPQFPHLGMHPTAPCRLVPSFLRVSYIHSVPTPLTMCKALHCVLEGSKEQENIKPRLWGVWTHQEDRLHNPAHEEGEMMLLELREGWHQGLEERGFRPAWERGAVGQRQGPGSRNMLREKVPDRSSCPILLVTRDTNLLAGPGLTRAVEDTL